MDPQVQTDRAFDIVRRGYDRGQVDRRLQSLETELTEARRELTASERRNGDLAEQLRNARAELSWRGQEPLPTFSDRVERILTLAEEEAAETREKAGGELAEARQRARAVLDEAQDAARRQHQEANHHLQRLHAAQDDLRERLRGARDLIDQVAPRESGE